MTLALDLRHWRYMLRVLLALLLMAAVAAVVARAHETVRVSGEGAGIASGYAVSNIMYSLVSADPRRVQGVSFTLVDGGGKGVPGRVTVTVDGGVHWVPCEPADGLRWFCRIDAWVRQLTELRVVAAQ